MPVERLQYYSQKKKKTDCLRQNLVPLDLETPYLAGP
jgi:hypothetical protein